MDYITTTQLRTHSTNLINALLSGEEVELIHRSKIVAIIKPQKKKIQPLTEKTVKELIKIAKSFNLPKLSDQEIERRYKKHLIQKYGQDFS